MSVGATQRLSSTVSAVGLVALAGRILHLLLVAILVSLVA